MKQMRLQFKIKVKVLVGLMETEAREEKVISEGHLARDPKVEKRGGETRLFSFNGKKKKKRCHMTQQKQTTKEDACKGKNTTAPTPHRSSKHIRYLSKIAE